MGPVYMVIFGLYFTLSWTVDAQIPREWIYKLQNYTDSISARKYLYDLTFEAHLAGTPGEERTSAYVRDELQKNLGDFATVQRIPFEAMINYPIERSVQMLEPTQFDCSLTEPPVAEDPSSVKDGVMSFHGYGASGDVTAGLVYANYGLIEDFQWLESNGISIEGKIVIVKYGSNFRGTKVQLAEQRGAVGVLIYSDPRDDGYVQGPVFPNGPWRTEHSVQRGSVLFLNQCPGDPHARMKECLNDTTKNYTGNLVPSIPSQPLSWGDAYPLLQSLQGQVAPDPWQGGLNFTYYIGDGATIIRLYSDQRYEMVTLYNVIARIEGRQSPNEYVLVGNHRDAWVFGAVDPSSGTSCLLELSKALGGILNDGWRPRRTIILASWDGEEYGLIGSTHYGEQEREMLLEGAIAYINLDTAVSGNTFGASASPSLAGIIRTAVEMVTDPERSVPIGDLWNGDIGVLGSGSDYTVFLHHLGIPSIDFGFRGPYGVYHSKYDSFYWMENIGDPGFRYHNTATQLLGTFLLLITDQSTIPLNFTDTAIDITTKYIPTLKSELKDWNGTDELNLTGLEQAAAELLNSAQNLDVYADNIQAVNSILRSAERYFLDLDGLPYRFWFKHVLQAPGITLGYGSDVFPGLLTVIRLQEWDSARQQVLAITGTIRQAANHLSTPIPPIPPSDDGLSGGLIALISVASVIGLFLLCGILRYIVLDYQAKRKYRHDTALYGDPATGKEPNQRTTYQAIGADN